PGLGVERVLGGVGILTVILLLLPFARDITQKQSFGELVAAMWLPLAAATLFGVLILIQPGWFRGLLRLLPGGRARRFAASVIDSASAYSGRRRSLLLLLLRRDPSLQALSREDLERVRREAEAV